ncbi:MAG: phage shock protein A [Zetaproteobacteria bacterium]|nr:phage shock protein A [Pseudobdellovibrionaceae bacterium]|tara:strand:- start:105 stop:800 length:696 start_codon:yes stop_codon:yes gene_type:complete
MFSRLFRVVKSESHAVLDKIEDPIKMTEQGIRDLQKDLAESMKSLAQSKAVLIKMRKDAEEQKSLAESYEKKAILLLKKGASGGIDATEADRLAGEALAKKDQAMTAAVTHSQTLDNQEAQTRKMEGIVSQLKSNISKWENELVTLKSRAKIAEASKKLNAQLAHVDSGGTLAMLEKMKTKVSEDEALAESYGEMAAVPTSVDDEIDKALAGDTSSKSSDSLAALKAKLNM